MKKQQSGTAKNKAEKLLWAEKTNENSVDAGSAFPIDDVNEFPGILIELELNLALFVHGQLASGIEDAGALALVGVVDVEFTGGEVKGLRLCVGVDFAEAKQAIGNPADFAAGGSGDHADEGDVVTQSAGDGAMADGFHFGKGVDEAIVLALFEGLDEDLAILRSGEVINFNTDANDLAELRAGAHGAGFDGFVLHAIAREKGKGADGKKSNEH